MTAVCRETYTQLLKEILLVMKKIYMVATLAAVMALGAAAPRANAADGDVNSFKMVVSSGAANCISPDATAQVTITDRGAVQNMRIEAFHLPPSTEFTVFLIQVPNKPFGLSWYQGDLRTNLAGHAVGDFVGIFSRETFIQGTGVAPAPQVFPDDAATNPATPPVQIYHMGIWFADPTVGGNFGCTGRTPFDGDHEAGIQILNTSNFPDTQGPLSNLQ